MSKKIKRILTASIISLIAFTVIIAVTPNRGSGEMTAIVEITDSKATPEFVTSRLTIPKNGTYILGADWSKNEQPGFITGLTILDEAENEVYSIAGGLLSFDTEPLKLKAGKYTFRYEFLCDEDSYNEFLRAHSLPEGSVDKSWFKDGTWHFGCRVKTSEGGRLRDAVMIICGLVIGLMLAYTIMTVISDDKTASEKYDERQIAVQGKAYKRGFFSFLAINVVLMAFSAFLGNFAEPGVYLLIGTALGSCVTITILIMNDAYFKVNESKQVFCILFAVFAVINLVLGICNIWKGYAIENGLVSFTGTANLIIGLMIIYTFTVLLIKNIRDSKEDEDEES